MLSALSATLYILNKIRLDTAKEQQLSQTPHLILLHQIGGEKKQLWKEIKKWIVKWNGVVSGQVLSMRRKLLFKTCFRLGTIRWGTFLALAPSNYQLEVLVTAFLRGEDRQPWENWTVLDQISSLVIIVSNFCFTFNLKLADAILGLALALCVRQNIYHPKQGLLWNVWGVRRCKRYLRRLNPHLIMLNFRPI